MDRYSRRIFFLASIFLAILFQACQSVPISELPQDEGIVRIRKSYENHDWSDVTQEVDDYKARYPYSPYIAESLLLQADSYFQSSKYPEAIVAYEDFILKNPTHKEIPFAYFRVGRCYDLQAPTAEDRDQTNSYKALEKYYFYLKNYPTTEWASDAQKHVAVLVRRLADSHTFVADFYWRKDLYAAALARYLTVLKQYSQFADLKKHARERVAGCYLELAQELEKHPDSEDVIYFKNETPAGLREKAKEYF